MGGAGEREHAHLLALARAAHFSSPDQRESIWRRPGVPEVTRSGDSAGRVPAADKNAMQKLCKPIVATYAKKGE